MDDIITIPEGMPTPKTYKEWAVAMLCGLEFDTPMDDQDNPLIGPKTPIERYLDYAIANMNSGESHNNQ